MDDVLASVVREAEADPQTMAVVLHGSRAVGHERLMESHGIRTHDEWTSAQLR